MKHKKRLRHDRDTFNVLKYLAPHDVLTNYIFHYFSKVVFSTWRKTADLGDGKRKNFDNSHCNNIYLINSSTMLSQLHYIYQTNLSADVI